MAQRKASILIATLFVMVVVSLVSVSLAYRASIHNRLNHGEFVAIQLRNHASSTLSFALEKLLKNNNGFDHLSESWHSFTHDELIQWLFQDSPSGDLDTEAFLVECYIIDEERKLNLLDASSDNLLSLGLSESQISSLFDWMDTDDMAGTGGAEEEYYLSLAKPYACKDKPIENLEEVFAIRGFSLRDYLGEDANHNLVLDPWENDGKLNYPPDNSDGELHIGLVDLLTCYGDGRININTASHKVLNTLPLSDGAAEQIIAYRKFDPDSSGEIEDHVFQTAEDIMLLQGLTGADRDMLITRCIYQSTHYRIHINVVHMQTGYHLRKRYVVRMTDGVPQVIQ